MQTDFNESFSLGGIYLTLLLTLPTAKPQLLL